MTFGNGVEKRQFGRRTTCLHGWVYASGRPTLPCVVRNLSVQGALIELTQNTRMPFRFELKLEQSGQRILCETRHQHDHLVGVYFPQPEAQDTKSEKPSTPVRGMVATAQDRAARGHDGRVGRAARVYDPRTRSFIDVK